MDKAHIGARKLNVSPTKSILGTFVAIIFAETLLLLLLMYFGRAGLLTLSLGLISDAKAPKVMYPEEKIMIG